MLRHVRCIAALAVICLGPALFAQYPTTPDVVTGLSPMAVYTAGDFDNVDPANGNLFLDIPLLNYPQRGNKLRLNFKIYYNDKAWFIVPTASSNYSPNGYYQLGEWSWYPMNSAQVDNIGVYVARDQSLGFGDDTYGTVTNWGSNGTAYYITTTLDGWYVRSPDGSKHYYGDDQRQSCTQNPGACPTTYGNIGNSYPSTDATGYFPLNFSTASGSSSVLDADGVKYTVSSSGYETVSDPVGNAITVSATGWTDSIGRPIPGAYTLPGSSGPTNPSTNATSSDPVPGVAISPGSTSCPAGTYEARDWDVPSMGSGNKQHYYLCYDQYSYQTAFDVPNDYNNFAGVSEASSNNQVNGNRPAVLLTNIMLPNGTSYTFSYDSYLSLNSLTLPTGAVITYNWQNVWFQDSEVTPVSRALASRSINPGNGEAVENWYYQFLPNSSSSGTHPQWSIVTDPNRNDIEYTIASSDVSGPVITGEADYAGCSPHDTSNHCSGSGKLLKTVSYVISSFGSGGADIPTPPSGQQLFEPTTTTTTWQTNGTPVVSQVVTTMTSAYGSCSPWNNLNSFTGGDPIQPNQPAPTTPCYSTNQPYKVATYDFGSGGPGSLLKTVTTNYEWQQSNSYRTANLLNLPSSVVTTDGGGYQAAETDYSYDESTYSPTGTFGNLTTTARWENGNGAKVTTHTAYNTNGMPITLYSPRGYQTPITYDSTGAFPYTVTHPATNGVSHIDTYYVDSNTGLTTSHKDWNSNTTTYSYTNCSGQIDPLNRLGKITYPITADGTPGQNLQTGQGYKQYCYTDTPGSLAVTEQDLQSTTGAMVKHTTEFDDLGRVIHTMNTTDPNGTDEIDTTYDLLGNVHSVTNPYRQGDQIYLTGYGYDALNQRTSQQQPDGNVLQWCYNGINFGQSNCSSNKTSKTGRWVDAADETGRDWQRVSDGSGRLEAVEEPISAETDYQYNALDDLIRVDQWGGANGSSGDRIRTFQVDWMSRITGACNPEASPAGTTCTKTGPWSESYAYDADSNVSSKISYAVNSTSGTQTIGYCHDAIDRLTYKFYSSSFNCNSPSGYVSSYNYDSSSISGATNTNGLLTNETVFNGSTVVSQRSPFAYDAMGRLDSLQECTPANCSGTPYKITYTYDLAGNVTSSTNGVTSQFIQLNMSYDGSNRLKQMSSSWSGDSNHPGTLFQATSASPASYTPFNALGYAQLGINAQTGLPTVLMTRTYDPPTMRILSENDTSSTSASTGTITITGSEQSKTTTATSGTTTVSVNGSAPTPDSGYVYLNIGTAEASASYNPGSTATSIASTLASDLNCCSGSLVTATASGTSLTIKSVATGSSSNYSWTSSTDITHGTTAFSISPATGTMTGGANGGTIYDSGSITASLDGCTGSYSWGQSDNSSTIATGLASALNSSCGSLVSATASNGTVSLTGKSAGENWPVTTSVTYNSSQFSSASFSASPSGLSPGAGATEYAYSIPESGGYDKNGNLLNVTDSVTGTWGYGYDNVNRVITGTGISGSYQSVPVAGVNLGWSYDPFGNRTNQTSNSSNFPTDWAQYTGTNNQATSTNFATGGVGYDAAGDVTYDGRNHYYFDFEGRICATSNGVTTTGYVYDAEGNRVAKGSVSSLSCSLPSFSLAASYVLGANGEEVSELNGSGAWQYTNVFANGKLLATYSSTNNDTYFALNDWLGTKRLQVTPDGCMVSTANLPFGDDQTLQTISGSCSSDGSPLHFTGKERDQESGNDYFFARYYGSSTGRFLSPDNDDEGESDPSAPQSLNLYGYVDNNPLTNTDGNGHDCVRQTRVNDTTVSVTVTAGGSPGGCGSGTYVPGTVNSITAGKNGSTIDIGYTPYSGAGGGVMNINAVSNRPKMDEGAVIPGDDGLGLIVGWKAGGLVGDAFRGVVGWFRGAGAAAGEAAVGEVTSQAAVRVGGIIDRVFPTSAGPVRVYCEVTAEGSTAVVKDLAIYPANSSSALQVGYTQMRQGLRAIGQELKDQGFDSMRVENAYRVSGATPGRFTTFTTKLK